MNTSVISINTSPFIKTETKKIAKAHGLTLSSLVNSLLQLVMTDTTLIEKFEEKPTHYLLRTIDAALKQKREGRVSPRFSNSKDAQKWLER